MNIQPHAMPAALSLLAFVLVSGCSAERDAAKKRIAPEYDKNGKLELLKYDSKGSGRVDTWSYMDGARVVRIGIDKNGDGAIDRWEYYGPDQTLVRTEEDTDADGRMDKWETYDGTRLASVAFDTSHRRGVPDRRLTYGPGGTATMDLDAEGDGRLLRTAPASPALVSSNTR